MFTFAGISPLNKVLNEDPDFNIGAGSSLTSVPSKGGQMTTTGTSTSRSYAGTVDSADMVKSGVNGTALLDASLANDAGEDWDTDAAHEDAVNDSGALLRKQKPVMMQQQQQNFANFPMVSTVCRENFR